MRPDPVLSMISLAMKAGAVASGETKAEQSVRAGRAKLVILAGDASDNTKKKFNNRCESYQVPVMQYGLKDELGRCIGKEQRSVIAVTDQSFAGALTEKIRRNLVDGENQDI